MLYTHAYVLLSEMAVRCLLLFMHVIQTMHKHKRLVQWYSGLIGLNLNHLDVV
jgi:hypothetical protein